MGTIYHQTKLEENLRMAAETSWLKVAHKLGIFHPHSNFHRIFFGVKVASVTQKQLLQQPSHIFLFLLAGPRSGDVFACVCVCGNELQPYPKSYICDSRRKNDDTHWLTIYGVWRVHTLLSDKPKWLGQQHVAGISIYLPTYLRTYLRVYAPLGNHSDPSFSSITHCRLIEQSINHGKPG